MIRTIFFLSLIKVYFQNSHFCFQIVCSINPFVFGLFVFVNLQMARELSSFSRHGAAKTFFSLSLFMWWFQDIDLKVRYEFSSIQFSCSVVSDPLWPIEPQHARPPCLSPAPGVYPNSCPSRWWCHPTISSSVVPFSSCPQPFPASGSVSNEAALCIRWPKYWSFSFNIKSFQWTPRTDLL